SAGRAPDVRVAPARRPAGRRGALRRWRAGRRADHSRAEGLMSGNVTELVSRALDGEPRAIARLISLVEDGSHLLRAVAGALAPATGRARVLGLTGPPGVGK